MNIPPDKSIYRTIKLSLSQVLKPGVNDASIQNAVLVMNKLVTRSMFFLKHYILSDPERILTINENLLDCIMRILGKKDNRGRPPSIENATLQKKLKEYYEQYFKHLVPSEDIELEYTHLNTAIDYAADTWITAIKNNIIQQYVTYLAIISFHYLHELLLLLIVRVQFPQYQ